MKQIFSENAPAAVGPYCHAIINNDLVFCSGQLAFDPDTMEFVGSTIEEQTAQVMKNMETVLKSAGSRLDKIIKTTVFLASMNDFAGMNQVYESALNGHKPARSTVEVGRLPKDGMVEIECIAAVE